MVRDVSAGGVDTSSPERVSSTPTRRGAAFLRRHKRFVVVVVLIVVLGGWWVNSHRSRPAQVIALDRASGAQLWRTKVSAFGIVRISERGAGVEVGAVAEPSSCQFTGRDFRLDASGRVSTVPPKKPDTTGAKHAEDANTSFRASYRPGLSLGIELSATDRHTRVVRWSHTLHLIDLPDLVAGDGVLVASLPDPPSFSVIDSRSGDTLWTSTNTGAVAFLGGGDGRLYEATRHAIRARNARTGALAWQRPLKPAPRGFATAVVAANRQSVAVGFGETLVLRDHDGRLLYRTTLTAGPVSRLLLTQHRLYVGTAGKRSGGSCD